MQKHIKMLTAVLAAMLLAMMLALVGCSGGSSSTEQATDEAAETTETAATETATEGTTEATETAKEEPAEAVKLQVFAANSLSKAMDEAQALYTKQVPEVTFADTQYLSSGDLNAELEAGAYADIEITASKKTMDDAEEAGYIDPATRVTMFKNDLVIVTAASNDNITEVTLDDIAAGTYTVGIGDDSVPAGNYANQALSTVGCFNDPEGKTGADSTGKAGDAGDAAAYAGTPLEGKYTTADSVGNVCSLAETGAVDVAFVYTSDVERFGGVKVVGTVPADTHKDITYPGAVCAKSENAKAAQAFLDWCLSDPDAAEVWQKWGFELA